jgi:hypothetical protein
MDDMDEELSVGDGDGEIEEFCVLLRVGARVGVVMLVLLNSRKSTSERIVPATAITSKLGSS